MISLKTQTPSHSAHISVELKFSRTYLHNLELLLMRIPHPTPEIKEALHQIKKELNSSVTTRLEDDFEEHHSHQLKKKTPIISKQSQQVSRVGLALAATTLSANASSHWSIRPKRKIHKSLPIMRMSPPLNKTSSSSYFASPSPSTFNKVSTFKVKPDGIYFHTIIATPSF